MKKKLLSILLCLCMALSLLPTAALAADEPALRVGGVTVTNLTPTTEKTISGEGITGTVTYRYDSASSKGILTLNNAAVVGPEERSWEGIHAVNLPLEIVLEGSNTVTAAKNSAIYCYEGSLTISGSGSLTAVGGEAADSAGIDVTGGNLTITNGTVTAVGGKATSGSYGLYCSSNIEISGGTVTAVGGDGTFSDGIVSFGDIHFKGDAKTVAVGGVASGQSLGIYVDKDIRYTSGLLVAKGGEASNSHALSKAVTGDSLTSAAVTGTATGKNYVISPKTNGVADYHVVQGNVSGGRNPEPGHIDWSNGNKDLALHNTIIFSSDGISNASALDVRDGVTTVTGFNVLLGGTAGYSSKGLYSTGAVTLDNATLIAVGGKGSSDGEYSSAGVECKRGAVTLDSGSSLIGIGGSANRSQGVLSDSGLANAGVLTAVGGSAGLRSTGIEQYGDVTVGGSVTAVGGAGTNSYGVTNWNRVTLDGSGTAVAGSGTTKSRAFYGAPTFADGIGFTSGAYDGKSATWGVLPVIDYNLRVGVTQVTSANKANIPGGTGFASYDPATNTLTLNNYTYEGDGLYNTALFAQGDLNLALHGENSINLTASTDDTMGLLVSGKLTILGDGSLTVNGGSGGSASWGIVGYVGIEINGGTVTGIGKDTSANSFGIYSNGDITINDGTVTGIGKDASLKSYGISSYTGSSIIINGGTVTAQSGTAPTSQAMSPAPNLGGYSAYQWRTSTGADFTLGTKEAFTNAGNPAYVELMSARPTHSITVSTDGTGSGSVRRNGALVSGSVTASEGFRPLFTFTPSADSTFGGLKIDGSAVDAGYDRDNQNYYYQFEPITTGHAVLVTFTKTASSDNGNDSDSDSGDTSYPVMQPSGSGEGSLTQTGGSVTLSKNNAKPGDTVTATPKPEKGYELTGLTVKGQNNKEVPTTKNADGTISFKMPNGTVSIAPTFEKIQYYGDVPATMYYADAVWRLRVNGIMLGTSDGTFSGSDLLNRQQSWMLLARIQGQTPASMAAAKEWAVSANVSDGNNSGTAISRQQLAVMLYRAAGSPAVTESKLTAFSDGATVAAYAKDAMSWAVNAGILLGDNGKLNPTDPASRANAAVMFTRYLDAVQK